MKKTTDPRIEGLDRIRAQFAAIDTMSPRLPAVTIYPAWGASATDHREGFVCAYRDRRADTVHMGVTAEQLEAELAAAGLTFEHRDCAPAPSIVYLEDDGGCTVVPMPRPF